MQIARTTLANLCTQFGKMLLRLPDGIDPARLLWALAGNESSFGAESNPRHEQSYCYEHAYFNADRTRLWGCLAHCSYGPWQVMYSNFNISISPLELLGPTGVTLLAGGTTTLLQSIVDRQKARTIEEIGEAYNTGKIQPDPEYVAKLVRNYAVPIGALA